MGLEKNTFDAGLDANNAQTPTVSNNSKTINKLARISVIVIISSVIIAVAYTVFYNMTKPKPDFISFNQDLSSFVNEYSELINTIEYLDDSGTSFRVYVNNFWQYTSDSKKAEFCGNVRKMLSYYSVKNNISKEGFVYLLFYNSNGLKVAEPDRYPDFKILY